MALAGGHDVAVLAGRLEDEGGVRTPCRLLDDGRAGRRADLLVGVGDEDEATDGQPRRDRRTRPPGSRWTAASGASLRDRSQRRQRVETAEQAGLHVADAGPVGAAVADGEGPLGDGACVEDGVEVRDDEHRGARHVPPRCRRPCRRARRWHGARPTRPAPRVAARSTPRPRRHRTSCTCRCRCRRAARGRVDTRAGGLDGGSELLELGR